MEEGSMIGRKSAVVRRLRALRKDRRLARDEGVFVAEGIHLAREAIAEGASIERAVIAASLRDHPEGPALLADLERRGVPVDETAPTVIESLQEARSPRPILLVCRRRATDAASIVRSAPGPILGVITVGVQDPGNLGSIVRTSDAAGASFLVAASRHVDPFHPRCVRATAGSVFRLPVAEVETPDEAFDAVRAGGAALVGAVAGARRSYEALDWTRPLTLVLGAEAAGLPDEILQRIDVRVGIPMRPGVDSLSVGAAAAVLLFEAARQRRRT